MPRSRMIPLEDIVVDLSIQQRDGPLNQAVVKEYQEDMERGCEFPPIVVYHDGDAYWLSDGFHRYQAASDAGLDKIKAEVREGRRKHAVDNACNSNQGHGLRRTNNDKRRAVTTKLDLWPKRSDRWIAEQVGVDNSFVSKLRALLLNNKPHEGGLELPTEPMNGADESPAYKELSGIERQLLNNRELITEDPAEVAEQLGAAADDVAAVQTALEDNSREYKDGRKRYMPAFSKPTEAGYPAVEAFRKWGTAVATLHDKLAQEYEYDYRKMLESDDWDDRYNAIALNSLSENKKLLSRFEKELAERL